MSCACGGTTGAGAITHGKPGHARGVEAMHVQSEGAKSDHLRRVGISAAESFADARAKSAHAHDLASTASSVGEYLQAANYAAQAAHEASDLDPGSTVVSGYAAAADLAYNQIVAGGSTMALGDANVAAVAGIEAADSAIAQAEADVPVPEPVKPPPPGGPGGSGTPAPAGTGASATTIAATVVAIAAASVAGYYGWRYLKRSGRRAGAPRRRRR